jgi:uncharacterized protein YbjT (DUF2867 family)
MTGSSAVGPLRPASQLVTVFGGSGFVGRHVVRALAKRGYRVRVAVRHPERALFLQPLGRVGQIVAVQANLRYPASIRRAVERSDHVVNLVGVLQESGRQTFDALQAEGAGDIARAAAEIGSGVVHVSALGADPASPSEYAKAKARGEALVLEAVPGAVVLRPSVVFGNGDSFFNRFGELGRALPVLPLAGADTRFQPVFVGDVAEAAARAVDGEARAGAIYELGGPDIETLRALVDFTLATIGRRALVVPMPWPAARLQGYALEIADRLTLGLLPDALKLSRDQVELLKVDNVVSDAARAEGRTLEGLGIVPTGYEAVAASYLWRFRKAGQFTQDHRDESLSTAGPTDDMAPVPTGPAPRHQPGSNRQTA